ncbi:MAG TPA: type II toxin-antitoxin system RelE/ParE family toxin [Candidatus Brocadiaceae bacterium]|nr:type II toxin-antitoxin system RelE/ParE family toxin [Candidatus Brocadiaceae bacterium]
MFDIPYVLKVVFYRSEIGNEPVREWLKGLPREDKRKIGEDIKTAQIGWPLGMLLIRKIDKDLWEVRTRLENGIARVFFTVDGEYMILLHGFIKKSQKTPQNELKTALTRLGNYETTKEVNYEKHTSRFQL